VSQPQSHSVAESPSAPAAQDRRLLEACAAGEPAARAEFANRFGGLFRHIVDRSVDRSASAGGSARSGEERAALAIALVEACLRDDAAVLRGFAGRATPETYLTVAAHRLARRMLQPSLSPAASPSQTAGPTPAKITPAKTAPAASTPTGTATTHLSPDRERLERQLTLLEPDEARLVRLHRIQGRSYGEISQLTGLPLTAIGPALARARARMEAGPRQQGEG
jgi:RNA polymerase sigma-70 factor (ECF subfamily)